VAVLYIVCVAAGTIFTIYKSHPNSISEILWKIVLVAAIAGLIVILYVIAAYLGNKSTDRQIGE